MLKETITYTDFNGNERTEELWFNLSYTDLMGMFNGEDDPLTRLQSALRTQDYGKTLIFFRDLLIKAYGERSADGRKFCKSPAISEDFSQTAVFDQLFTQMTNDPERIFEFIKGVIPSDIAKKAGIDAMSLDSVPKMLPES